MSTCKTCGAYIEWAKTREGKAIPIDPELRLGGNIAFDNDGTATVVTPDASVTRHVSHFVTCPNASAHRKPRAR